MKSRLYALFTTILFGYGALSGCGGGAGGSSGSGASPIVSLSTERLTFGNEVVGTTSQPLPITLANTGTAPLTIASIAADANFAETNNCGSTLAAGATCTINVTLSPTMLGSVSGKISITDNALGTLQNVSVTGTGTADTDQPVLTGNCWGYLRDTLACGTGWSPTNCPPAQPAVAPIISHECLPPETMYVDASTSCDFKTSSGSAGSGSCIQQVTSPIGSCSVKAQECGAAQQPPCCSGLTCESASTGASCQ
jgi:hypothetical protein